MRELVEDLLSSATMKVLKPVRGGLLSQFRQVVIQDGSSFALKDRLRKAFPGRFSTVSPAAVELHVTYDLLQECAVQVALRPDVDSEQLELPAADELNEVRYFWPIAATLICLISRSWINGVRPVDTVPLREPSGRSEASREQPSGIFTGARRPDLLGVARRSEIIVAQVTR